MKNFVQSGESVTVVAPAGGVTSGDGLLIGAALFGVCQNTAAATEDVELLTQGVVELPKLSTDVVTAGAIMYWDDGNSRLTITASTHRAVGVAISAAGSGVTTAIIKLIDAYA